MGVVFTSNLDYPRTNAWLRRIQHPKFASILNKYGSAGVQALSAATPKSTGVTANAWSYEVKTSSSSAEISFSNSNTNSGVNIAIILQYGHGTRNGGYVSGRDYINPAIKPLFDKMAEDVWKEVTRV